MTGENETADEATATGGDRVSYERSTISFPYFDLAESVRMAAAIWTHAGGGECSDDQIAAWMGLSAKSSGYRARLSAARLFGLLETGKGNNHQLSELGLAVVDEARQRAGKAESFLRVPLFNRVFEQWRGNQLPPAAALERQLTQIGVAEKQTSRARQVLERSAQAAGFFEQGRDRLVRPGIKGQGASDPPPPPPPGGSGEGGDGNGSGTPKVDPIIAGLISRLPPAGAVWPKSQRQLWLKILENSFELVYRDDGPDEAAKLLE